jgi:hypothetical protein
MRISHVVGCWLVASQSGRPLHVFPLGEGRPLRHYAKVLRSEVVLRSQLVSFPCRETGSAPYPPPVRLGAGAFPVRAGARVWSPSSHCTRTRCAPTPQTQKVRRGSDKTAAISAHELARLMHLQAG